MYTTREQVLELTGYDVSQESVVMAQVIIESFTGRVESDVDGSRDRMLLGRATAYQAAYLKDNSDTVFSQIDVAAIAQFGQAVTFKSGDNNAPFVAPLAAIACKNLSWKGTRSVRTGNIYGAPWKPVEWSKD